MGKHIRFPVVFSVQVQPSALNPIIIFTPPNSPTHFSNLHSSIRYKPNNNFTDPTPLLPFASPLRSPGLFLCPSQVSLCVCCLLACTLFYPLQIGTFSTESIFFFLRLADMAEGGSGSPKRVVKPYDEAMDALSSLITKRSRADKSNKGDRFDLLFDYLKVVSCNYWCQISIS